VRLEAADESCGAGAGDELEATTEVEPVDIFCAEIKAVTMLITKRITILQRTEREYY
jgi:hypothetical protein